MLPVTCYLPPATCHTLPPTHHLPPASCFPVHAHTSLPRTQVQVIYLGFRDGDVVRTGAVMETCAAEANPCRHALINFRDHAGWGWGKGGRSSYDPLTSLLAVRGVSREGMGFGECASCDGVNYIDAANGTNHWVAGPPSNQSYVVLQDQAIAQGALDALLCQPRLADRAWPPSSLALAVIGGCTVALVLVVGAVQGIRSRRHRREKSPPLTSTPDSMWDETGPDL